MGADVNMAQHDTCLTPLHLACRRGLEEHVELLLRYGADVTVQNREGETPLNAACAGAERPAEAARYLGVVQRLLQAGAHAHTAGRKQHTALHNACSNCSYQIADMLLQHGARADAANCAGYTPMDCLLQVRQKKERTEKKQAYSTIVLYTRGAVSLTLFHKKMGFYIMSFKSRKSKKNCRAIKTHFWNKKSITCAVCQHCHGLQSSLC